MIKQKTKAYISTFKSFFFGLGFSAAISLGIAVVVIAVSVLGMPALIKTTKEIFHIKGKSIETVKASAMEKPVFEDVYDKQLQFVLNVFLKKRVVSLNKELKFRPDDFMTKAEFMKMVISLKKVYPSSVSYANCFDDVKADWSAASICFAKKNGFLTVDSSKFYPQDGVSLGFLLDVMNKSFNSLEFLRDEHGELSIYNALNVLKENGCDTLCNRFPSLGVESKLTRSDAAAIIYFLLRAESTMDLRSE